MGAYCPEDYTLQEIPNFLSLMPIAQKTHSTVYDIPKSGYFVQQENGELKEMSKSEISRHKERAKYFEQKYTKLAQLLLDIFNAEDSVETSVDPQNDEVVDIN